MRGRLGSRAAVGITGLLLLGVLAGCGTAARGPASPRSDQSATGRVPTTRWMTYSATAHHVTLRLVAGYNSNLSGFNFDGYGQGNMVVQIPTGWRVTVVFTNRGALPHSVAIMGSGQSLVPVFPGAGLPASDLQSGLAKGASATFAFTTGAPGRYRIACLVPGHEVEGMWDVLQVTGAGTTPTIHYR